MQLVKAYAIPMLVTFSLHSLVVVSMFLVWEPSAAKAIVKKPNFVQAKLVSLESKTEQKIKNSEKKPKVIDLTQKKKELERKKKIEEQKRKKVLETQKKAEEKKLRDKKAAEDAKRKAEDLQKAKAAEQRQKDQNSFDQALKEEQLALMEESYSVAAQSYMAAIAQRIEQNWSRPPSARNGMECELKIKLVPTGRVISVDVVRSSGNAQFDRSAEQAVKKVEQFPEVKEMKAEVFERYYRELTLVFRPQDLRQ